MGGSSSSNSSSSSSTTTNQYDQRVAVESNAIGIGAGATVNVTDGGILEGAGELAHAFNDTLQDGFGSLEEVASEAFAFSERIVKENNAILAEATEDNAKEIAESVIKFGVLGAVALMGMVLFMGKR